MRCLLAKSNRQLIWRIRALTLIISVVIVFGATPVFARGGGHGGGHGGGNSGGHGGHSGSHGGHAGGHTDGKHGRITSGTTTGGNFVNRRCPYTDKTWPDCPELTEKQWQVTPAEKTGNRFESRFE
jgi:hypothetical protein